MKKVYTYLILFLLLAFVNAPSKSYAQCPAAGFLYPSATQTPTLNWQVLSNESWAGDYALFNVVSGTTYEWSFCSADGGIVGWDSQLTLFNEADTSIVLAYSDDACGLDAKITWAATFSGVVRLKLNEYDCIENQDDATLVYRSIGVITPPANDACVNAIFLPVNANCVMTAGDVSGASMSLAGCTGDANDDVWYAFTATTNSIAVMVEGSLDFDAVLEVFSGNCGGLTSIACIDTSLEAGIEGTTFLNLTVGNTYYVRVYDYYSSFPSTTTFNICVYSIATCSITSPPGAVAETETCGLDQNGGCNMLPSTPVYQPISCGTTIYGTSWSSAISRDTDWFNFSLSSTTTVNLTANAEFPYQILLVDISNCSSVNILDFADGPACASLSLNTSLPAGNYAAFISHAEFVDNPCSSPLTNYTLTLNYNTPASITANGPTTICAGGSVMLTATAGQSYLWTTGATTQSITVTTGGSYGVTVTYAGGCTSVATPVNVTVSTPTTTITPSGTTTFCTGGNVNLTASAGNSYLWSTGATIQTINVTSTGSYTVTVTYSGGCTSSASQSVTVNTAPATTITPSGATTFCQGSNVTLTASAGNSYLWSTGATSQNITASSSGTYTVTVTYSGGCTSSASQTVTVNTAPATTITPSGPITFCTGGSVNLTASSGASYLWSNSSTSQTITVSASGNYTVTVTYVNGCTSSATQNVNVNTVTNTTITPAGSTDICPGGSVSLTATAGNSYLWSGGQTSQTINATSAGNYVVTVTYANGCTSSANLAVTVQTVPGTTITPSGSTTFCSGGSVTLTAGAGNSYLWSTGSTNQAITASTSGNYVVTVTYAGGCTGTASQTVTVNTAPATTITPSGSTTFCTGGSVNLTASTGTSYNWSSGNVTQTISATTTGNYTVTVTYSNGCTSSASQTVTVNSAPATTITPSGPTTFCQGNSVTLSASSGTSYIWSGGQSTQDINVITSGSYTVTVTYSNGCTSSATQSVTVTPVPSTSITPSGPTTLCPGADVDLTATSGTSYLWSNGNTSQTINVNSTGTYIVTVTYSSGCTATASMAVNVSSAPVTEITTSTGGTSICAGEDITLTATTGTSYLWSTGATTQSIVVNTSGSFDVTVTYPGNCSSTSVPVNITVNTAPTTTITPSGPTTFCDGGNVILSASSGQSYLWSDGSSMQTLNVSASGNYTVTVTYANGCTSSASTTVPVNSATAPTITASGSTTICQGESVVLTSSNAQVYLWTGGSTSQSITVTSAGIYQVTITDANGCTATSSQTVTVNPLPATPVISVSGTDLTSSAASGNQWYFNGNIITGATGTSYTPLLNGDYTVVVTDANGCTATSAAFTVTWVSISENIINTIVSVYPNPTSDNFVIELQGVKEADGIISITNALGQLVKSEILIPANEMKWMFNVTDLKPGIYFVQLQFENNSYITKFVVER